MDFKYLLRISFLLISLQGAELMAQVTVSGLVVSAGTGEELPFAHVCLKEVGSDIMFNAITDDVGKFRISHVSNGQYELMISVIGYQLPQKIMLNVADKSINLKKIKMASSRIKLDEITVSAEKSYMETKPGKKVINVGQDIINAGGSAIELLSMAPGMEVNVGGQISIRGENDVYVLINGKETVLSELGAGKALKQIPVSNIEKIEIITNAGANYSPDGEGGMINVILKNTREEGLKFTIGTDGELSPLSSSATLGIEYKKHKWDYQVNYSIEKGKSENTSKEDRQHPKSLLSEFSEESSHNSDEFWHFIMGGVNFHPSDSIETGLTLMYESGNYRNTSDQTNRITKGDLETSIVNTKGKSKDKESMLELSLEHSQEFKSGGQLSAYVSLGKQSANSTNRYIISQEEGKHTDRYYNKSTVKEVNGEIDYTQPIHEIIGIGVGLQSEISAYNTFQNNLINEKTIKQKYHFNQSKHAIYLNAETELGIINSVLGVRMEHYKNEGRQVGNNAFDQKYVNVYPNVQLSTDFGLLGLDNSVMFSYSKRINRPDFVQLNPTTQLHGRYSQSVGNPNLKPEFAHVMELAWEMMHEKFTFSSTLFSRTTNNVIEKKFLLRPNNVVLNTYVNESSRFNMGAEFYLKLNCTPWWDMSHDFTIYRKKFKQSEDVGYNKSVNWYYKVNNNLSLGRGLKFQIKAKYVGKETSLYVSSKPYFTADIGASLSICKKKGRVYASLSDVFKSIKYDYTSVQNGLTINHTSKNNTRMLNIGVLFNF